MLVTDKQQAHNATGVIKENMSLGCILQEKVKEAQAHHCRYINLLSIREHLILVERSPGREKQENYVGRLTRRWLLSDDDDDDMYLTEYSLGRFTFCLFYG